MPVGKLATLTLGNTVILSWNKPKKDDSLDEEIFYNVECFSCNQKLCNHSCTNGERFYPEPKEFNKTSVVVYDLKPRECYTFKIYPKNSLNYVVPKEKWKILETSRICIPGKSKIINILLQL